MVPPDSIFGVVPIWVGVFAALAGTLGVSGALFYRRVVRLVLLGRREARFDRPMRRFVNFLLVFVGQRKVVQRVSLRDMAGIGHALIFFGFLSFLLSYAIFIFGDSAWGAFSQTLLTEAGARAYAMYLDVVALVILSALVWCGDSAVGAEAPSSELRPDAEYGRNSHRVAHRGSDGEHVAHRGVLRGERGVGAGVVGDSRRGVGSLDAGTGGWELMERTCFTDCSGGRTCC